MSGGSPDISSGASVGSGIGGAGNETPIGGGVAMAVQTVVLMGGRDNSRSSSLVMTIIAVIALDGGVDREGDASVILHNVGCRELAVIGEATGGAVTAGTGRGRTKGMIGRAAAILRSAAI